MGGVIAGAALFVGIVMLALYVAALWWVSFTYFHWCNRDRRGYGHCLGVGIVLVVLGGLNLLGNMGLSFATVTDISGILSLLLGIAQLVIGILLLVNRSKPETQAAFGVAPGAPRTGMAN